MSEQPSQEDIRGFILDRLGEEVGGLTPGELLEAYLAGKPKAWVAGRYAHAIVTAFLCNIVRLRRLELVKRFCAVEGVAEYAMPDDPWYHEPKQRFMRKIVLQLLQRRIAGHSQFMLAGILSRRDKECDATYTRRLLSRMLDEGIVIVADGVEPAMTSLLDTDGHRIKPQGIITIDNSPIERPAKVYRLSSSRWLKDTANDS